MCYDRYDVGELRQNAKSGYRRVASLAGPWAIRGERLSGSPGGRRGHRARGPRRARATTVEGALSARSRRPDTSRAGHARATWRHRTQAPGEKTTLTWPVSSSRFTKTAPCARLGVLAVGDHAGDARPGCGRSSAERAGGQHPHRVEARAGRGPWPCARGPSRATTGRRRPPRPASGSGSGGASAPVHDAGQPVGGGLRRRRPAAHSSAPAARGGRSAPASPSSAPAAASASSWARVTRARRTRSSSLGPGAAGHDPLGRRRPRSRAPRPARAGAPGSSGRPALERRRRPGCGSTSGRRTLTPWRRASATRLWGDQNPIGWALSRPARKAAG